MKVALRDIPSFYMMKLAYGPRVLQHMQISGIDMLKIESPIEETLRIVAQALNKRVQDVVVMMLDRPRHKEMVAEIRRVGASLRMISDGDIAAAMAPAIPDSGIDLYFGIGGCAGSGAGRGGHQMSRRRHAMRDVAARREGAQEPHRRRVTKPISAASFLPTISRTARTSFFARRESATARCCAA